MSLLPERQFDLDGRLDWRSTLEASLAARPLVRRRIPARFAELARRLPIGGCLHCSTPWGLVAGHGTLIAGGRRVFVLCEACWAELPVPARRAYYNAQYRLWLRDTARYPYGPKRDAAIVGLMDVWRDLERAVERGG